MPRPHVAPLPREGRIEAAAGWFAERLRQARKAKGLSQEALALAAELSPRHLSFLETGRAAPSEEMVHRLMGVLDLPLAERNRILVAEGWEPRYPDPEGVPTVAEEALRLTFEAHEPFPVVLLSESSAVLRANRGGWAMLRRFTRDQDVLDAPFDMVSVVLDPRFCREFVVDWEVLAMRVLTRLHLAHLEKPRDTRRRRLLDRALNFEGVSDLWKDRTESVLPDPVIPLRLRREGTEVAFRTVLSVLSEPLQPLLAGLFVETYHPADQRTRQVCHDWAEC